MVRVLITRPEPGAARTLKLLVKQGIEATSIPLTEIHPMPFECPVGDFDALIITSQNAIRHGASLLEKFMAKPVFAVGKRTTEYLQRHTISAWAETADELLPKITAQPPRHILYVCGQTRRPELELGLKAAAIQIEAVEVYSAAPAKNAPEKLRAFFESQKTAQGDFIVLFHAPSAVDAFISALKDHNLPETTKFLCLSATIAAHLPLVWQSRVSISENPDEAAMKHRLDKMLA